MNLEPPVNIEELFDPRFTGDPLPDLLPDLTGAKIRHIALDCTLRVSLSSGWRVNFEGPSCVVLPSGEVRQFEFISDVLPDDKYLTPELRDLVGETVTEMHYKADTRDLALVTPRGRIAVASDYAFTPWEMWGIDAFINGGSTALDVP
ncbi:DUF6188 family protein [Intrasporangium sp. DVR]|uniref:DUF6188 family protein n=1 Tax=Intrasporangium sp. DVR TaxID=3127867 RepID=UPI00313A4F92